MKRAVIDLGTNTFNLLIGSVENGRLVVDYTIKEAVMLGMGGINRGIIAEDAMDRAKQTLTFFREKCNEFDIQHIVGLGTSAMRAARNSDELIDFARNQLDIDVRVITGQMEAELIYKGVSLAHTFDEEAVIMDIGGGSNEFIHALPEGVESYASFDIGVSRIYQQLGEPERFSESVRLRMDHIFERETAGFFDRFSAKVLIGASGSFETMYEMLHKKHYEKINQSVELPLSSVHEVIDWSLNSTLEERMQHPWIVPMRKKMLPIAAYSVLWVLEKLQSERVLVSPYSLKEGAFLI